MKENNNILGKIIIAAILIIFGSVIIGVIADQTYSKTSLIQQTDTFTLEQNATGSNNITYVYQLTKLDDGWRQTIDECSKSTLATGTNIIIYNSTGTEMTNNGVCSDITNEYYIIEGESTLLFCNSANMNSSGATATVKYATCPEEYVSGWGGNVLNMVGGFLALVLFGAAIGILFQIYKEFTE